MSALAVAFAAMLLISPASLGQSAPVAMDHAILEAPISATGASRINPKYRYLFAPTARWAGTLHWKYNHANAPASLAGDKAAIVRQLQASFDKWTAQCGVAYAYDGETTVPPNNVINDPVGGPRPDGASVVGWGLLDPGLGAWTQDWWSQSGADRFIFDADMTLSVTNVNTLDLLDRLATHEWGHAIGLDHSNVEAAIMAGPPLTHYNNLALPQPDDVRGCRCQYGLPSGTSAAYACSVPAQIEFGTVATGASSAAQSITLTNSGNAPLSILAVGVNDAQFAQFAGCAQGTSITPGASCTLQIRAAPASAGAIAAQLTIQTNDGEYGVALNATGARIAALPAAEPSTADVIEYYNKTLDHYFITWTPSEIAKLDAGETPTRWTRTGLAFKAYATSQAGTSNVCRLYIPPANGDSHFFGRSSAECSATESTHSDFVVEDPSYMQLDMPTAGVCAAGTQPLYRLFDNRADVNHRYVTDRTVRDQMTAAGWLAEGDGPDLVVLCAPL